MDPTINPTPTPNPAPSPTPDTPSPAAPAPTPSTAAGGMTNSPVNPVIKPAPAVPGAATHEAATAGVSAPEPVSGAVPTPEPGVSTPSPVGNPTAQPDGIAATDPIMMPEPAPEPDPVEEELKAPMKAAGPVPGSIGSAVSGPAAGEAAPAGEAPAANPFVNNSQQTPNVAFNDPATQPDPAKQTDSSAASGGNTVVPAKKKANKKTLIALIIIAGVIVIALVAILISQLMNNQSAPVSTGTNTPVEINDSSNNNSGSNTTDSTTTTTTGDTLSCTRNMTGEEIARLNDAASGTISISAEFNNEEMLSKITLTEMVTYNDENAINNEPVENVVHEASADDLTLESAKIYYLPTDRSGALDLDEVVIRSNYESLDFTCKVL